MNHINHRNPMKLIRAADYASALAHATADPDCFVEVFLTAWSDVDCYRADAAARGLSARIGIHHQSALDALVELEVLPPSGPRSPTGRALILRLDSFIRAATASLAARFTVALSR